MDESNLKLQHFAVRSDVEHTASAVLDVARIASEEGLEVWICFGGLLGIVRDGGLLPWNNDVELGCLHTRASTSRINSTARRLSELGYVTCYYSTIGALSVRHPVQKVQVNLNLFWEQDKSLIRPDDAASKKQNRAPMLAQVLWWLATLAGARYLRPAKRAKGFNLKFLLKEGLIKVARLCVKPFGPALVNWIYRMSQRVGGDSKIMHIPSRLVYPLEKIDFYDGSVLGPSSPQLLLEYLYGPEWKTPKDSWSFYATENRTKTSIYFEGNPWTKYGENFD